MDWGFCQMTKKLFRGHDAAQSPFLIIQDAGPCPKRKFFGL